MDSIDITDSAFSLEAPTLPETLNFSGNLSSDYTSIFYIGIGILILVGLFYFGYYKSKKNGHNNNNDINDNLDCSGGFCTMNQSPQ